MWYHSPQASVLKATRTQQAGLAAEETFYRLPAQVFNAEYK